MRKLFSLALIGAMVLVLVSQMSQAIQRPSGRASVGCGSEQVKVNGQPYSVSASKTGWISNDQPYFVRSYSANDTQQVPGLKWEVTGYAVNGPTQRDDDGSSYTPYRVEVKLSAGVEFQYAGAAPAKDATFTTACTQAFITDYHRNP